MSITTNLELPIGYVKITGPGVDALENRKETGSLIEISEADLRASYLRVREPLLKGIKSLCNHKII